MPIFQTIINRNNTTVYVWNITEPEAWLRDGVSLTDHSVNRIASMSSSIHRRGFLSIRHLLHLAGYTDSDLYYTVDGKPHLRDNKHISITHSFEFTAIIISDAPVGIDIEKKRPKITYIAPKFINCESEFVQQSSDPITALTVIWGAKESMYKLYATRGLSFKQHCCVNPFDLDHNHTISGLKHDNNQLLFDTYYQSIEQFVLVYILPKQP